MLTVRSTINIASQTVPPIIPVVQGDTGRAILFTLADFTIPAGAAATYYVQKPSGEAVYNNATIDGNTVLVELTAQSIIEKGDNYGQVRITVGEDVVTSFDFILLVKEFRGIDAVQSLTEMNIFDKAVEQAAEEIDEVKTGALDDIGDAKEEAIEEVTSNFDLKLDASSTKGVQNQVITQAINTVNNAIGDLSGETVTPTATHNYGVGGNVGQVIDTWATTDYWHGIYTVTAGNTYCITTVSDFPQQIVVWFTNASNTIIENHKAFATDHVEMVCTAPTGATKLFVMSYGYDAYHGSVQKVEPLSNAVTSLKEELEQLYVRGSNRLNLNAMTANTYINVDGSSTSSQNFSVTDYIPVTANETIYFWSKRTDNFYYLFDARFLCAYDSGKNAVSASGGTWVSGSYTVPSGIAYVRLSISNTYLSTWTDFYVGALPLDSHDEYVPYSKVYPIEKAQVDTNTANIATNTANIATNTANIASITKTSSNLLDVSAITADTYITKDGTVNSLNTLSVTDYLPVEEGDVIYGWGLNDGAYSAITFRFICAYDESKTPIPASGKDSEDYGVYTVPNGVAYLRFTLRNAVLSYENLYIGTHNVGVDYEEYGVVLNLPASEDTTYSVTSGGSILDGVKYCYAHNITHLLVEAGSYDIISEYESHYGATYFDDYVDYNQGDIFDAGIWLQNIKVTFSAGAEVSCKYTGNNANVPQYFSAFATGNNVEIDGLVLDAENLRYGIHADYNSGANQTYFIVKNCDLKHYKNSTSMQAIGAGFGRHVMWQIEDTIFRSAGGDHIVFRVHNNVNSDAQSKMIVKDCYIDGDGYFQFNAYSTSTLQSIIQVCGCSYKVAPVVGRETNDSNDNFTMIAWNNEVR